jgi:hypothetical protein
MKQHFRRGDAASAEQTRNYQTILNFINRDKNHLIFFSRHPNMPPLIVTASISASPQALKFWRASTMSSLVFPGA